ncbi:MAG TPA: hypothetical protein VF150_09340 [Thermoanaerobaculia bacterium]
MPLRAVSISWVVLAGLAVLFIGACAEGPALVGFWESVETSMGGIGTALDFQPGGRLRQTVVVLLEGEYRLEDDRVVLDEDFGEEGLGTWTLSAPGTMEMSSTDGFAEGKAMRKKRFRDPSNGRSPIVGDWAPDPPAQLAFFERYTEDGRILMRLPMTTSVGSYRLEGSHLRVEVEDRAEQWVWRLDGDELSIGRVDGELRFRRVPGGPWYLPPET